MEVKELYQQIKNIGIPCTMHSFKRGKDPKAPFIIFYRSGSNNFRGDDRGYFRTHDIAIELYTDHKDEALEEKIRQILEDAEFDYTETEAFLPEEMLIEVLFETTIY